LKQPTPIPSPPRLTTVNPLIVNSFRNISNERIAWRILCNAPTRYVVTPNKGFLFRQEKIEVQVLLLNSSKYHRRHAFVVQAKTAKIDESNRKVIITRFPIFLVRARVPT
uniref:MSP domain-containing protein n=1 Tax=Angiostrongylus cantonensis TaxID=6313 RepID=A0A0K0D588_ANGCA